jgi:hypothetical protein
MDQELPSQQHQQAQQQHQQHTPAMSPINREHAPLSASPSPEDDRSSYCLTQNASHLYKYVFTGPAHDRTVKCFLPYLFFLLSYLLTDIGSFSN